MPSLPQRSTLYDLGFAAAIGVAGYGGYLEWGLGFALLGVGVVFAAVFFFKAEGE